MTAGAARTLKFAATGLDHRHIYEMTGHLLEQGGECVGYWTEGEPAPLPGFVRRFPHIPRVADTSCLLEDPTVQLVLTAAVNCDRAGIAIAAMRHGKDVMSDKPGCTTAEQLAELRRTVAETGRIWSVNYSERFQVRAVTRAIELVRAGAIGRVVQTVGLGPHRLNRQLRPAWFFQRDRYGGVLCDIASHQVEQFLTFTGSTDAEVVASAVGNFANPTDPGGLGQPGRLSYNPTSQFGVASQTLATGLGPSLIPGELNPLFQIGGPRTLQFGIRLLH